MEAKQRSYFYRWLILGGLGAVLFGAGLSATIEVAFMRYEGAPFWTWFLFGTLSLCFVVAGLACMIDSVRWKIKMNS
ncbi:MAG: hypothetical protein ACK5DD_01665 [Cyclobacteriaceae bacterium]|jgi:hypothetical protein